MKAIFIFTTMACLSMLSMYQEPSTDLLEVSNAVHQFAKNADNHNVSGMQEILHEDFRAIVNQAFGSKEVQIMDKTSYIDLLKAKKIGGDQREVIILSIDLEDKNAIVKAKFAGTKLTFMTFIQLVKDVNGHWSVMSDMPKIDKVG